MVLWIPRETFTQDDGCGLAECSALIPLKLDHVDSAPACHMHHSKMDDLQQTNENRHNLVTTIRNGGRDGFSGRGSRSL